MNYLKYFLLPALILLGLFTLSSSAESHGKYHPIRKTSKAFIYELTGQDIRIHQVNKNGTLKIIYHDLVYIGQFPRCLLVSQSKHVLYVGSDADSNDDHCGVIFTFSIQKNGLLSRIGAIAAWSDPNDMIISPSGSFLYCAAVDGVLSHGLIYQYRIQEDGELTALKPNVINLGSRSANNFVNHPSGKYLYGVDGHHAIFFRINQNGTLQLPPQYPTEALADDITISPSGKYAYLLTKGNTIVRASIDVQTGHFSSISPVIHAPWVIGSFVINPLQNTLTIFSYPSAVARQFKIASDGSLEPVVPPPTQATLTDPLNFPSGYAYVTGPQ